MQSIHIQQLVNDFFNNFFHILSLKVFCKTFSKEESDAILQDVFDGSMKAFEGFFSQIAMQDLGATVEIKKILNDAYTKVKTDIENFREQQTKIIV